MKKCSCGEPIFREDRDCCDACYNTGIKPDDEICMLVEYYTYNYNPKPAGVIGLSRDDIQTHISVKEYCCQEAKDDPILSYRLGEDMPRVCNHCGRKIKYKHVHNPRSRFMFEEFE